MMSKWFDEIHDSSGNIRTHYNLVYQLWKSIPQGQKKHFQAISKTLMDERYAVDPLPRIITKDEFSELYSGVHQRAQAIRAFLLDYYCNGTKWKKVIPSFTMRTILKRNHTESFIGKLKPESIAFPYGPDIIRDQSGKWRVVEDSAGFIGGMGDLLASRDTAFRLIPRLRRILRTANDPHSFFENLASRFNSLAKKKDGIALLLLPPFENESDLETIRLAHIFERLGVQTTTTDNQKKKLIIERDGMFLISRGKKEKVGYLVLRTGPELIDYQRQFSELRLISSGKIKNPEQNSYRNVFQLISKSSIVNALLKNQTTSNFSPGVSFLNDKAFGLYVDKLVMHFLKESPLLEYIPAQSFAYRDQLGNWSLDRLALRKVKNAKNKFVIKQVDQDGGSGVFIGPKLTQYQFQKALDLVRQNPEKYIFQSFEHLSVLENRIVDLRIHAHVDAEKIIISNNPWGRANWIQGDGKVNISSKGFTSPVAVIN